MSGDLGIASILSATISLKCSNWKNLRPTAPMQDISMMQLLGHTSRVFDVHPRHCRFKCPLRVENPARAAQLIRQRVNGKKFGLQHVQNLRQIMKHQACSIKTGPDPRCGRRVRILQQLQVGFAESLASVHNTSRTIRLGRVDRWR